MLQYNSFPLVATGQRKVLRIHLKQICSRIKRTRFDQQLRVVMKVLYKLIRREDKLELLIDAGSSPLFCFSKVK